MRAYWIVHATDGVRLELRDVRPPEAKDGQLLIKVRASCFNRGELIPGHGAGGGAEKPGGAECAGEIAAIGAGVSGFALGERVMGRCVGGFAEYALMDAREALRMPARLSWEEAAAIPLVFMVVHDMLVTHGHLAAGEWLLITGASSGVGVAALQAAKALGARVIGTSGSAEKLAKLEQLGLDVGVKTRGGGFYEPAMAATSNQGVDLIVNTVGGTVFAECIKTLATVGYLDRTMHADIDLGALHAKRLQLFGVSNKLRPPAQRALTVRGFERDFLPYFADGRIKPVIDRVFPFSELPTALAYVESNAMMGKVVVTL
jgi:NADPH2:quinone reductase